MSSDELDEPAPVDELDDATTRADDVDGHSGTAPDDEGGGPIDPRLLRRDIDDVARDLGALTSRVSDLEDMVNAHGWVLDRVEDLGKRISEQPSGDDAPEGETATPGPEPTQREAGPDDSPPAGGGGDREPDRDRPAIDIDVLCDWVHNNIAQLIERKVRGRVDAGPHWCPQWWQHPEAILRFEGLRQAWETLIPEGGTGLVIYLNYLDQTLNALTADAGPFHAGSCKHNRHNNIATLGDHPYSAGYCTLEGIASTPGFDNEHQ